MSRTAKPIAAGRDRRIDFLRGLCLLDMVLVHMIAWGLALGWWGHLIFAEVTRFAAGGFILVSGLAVSVVFLARVYDPQTRLKTYRRLLARAGYVLMVHYAMSLSFLLMASLEGRALPPIGQLLTNTFLLRDGHDLLPLYVLMLAASPLMLELLRRGVPWVLGVSSAAVFAWSATGGTLPGLPIEQTFAWPLWQVFFVAGLLLGARLHRWDAAPTGLKRRTLVALSIALVGLTLVAYAPWFSLTLLPGVHFTKVPLNFPEVLRYLALIGVIFVGVDLLWGRLVKCGRVVVEVERLGRHALTIFVAHVLLAAWCTRLSVAYPLPGVLNLFWFVVAVAALLLVAMIAEAGWRHLRDTGVGATSRRPAIEPLLVPGWTAAAVLTLVLAASPVAQDPPLTGEDELALLIELPEPPNQPGDNSNFTDTGESN